MPLQAPRGPNYPGMDSAVRSLPMHRFICSSCLRTLHRAVPSRTIGLQNSLRMQQKHKSYIARPGEQASPLTGFYSELMSKPVKATAPATRTAPAPQEPSTTDRDQAIQRARVVFGSRLAGPAERRSAIDRKSTNIAGILVPPRPEEPDNCCMSGCVNCVWDIYRDDLEEWAAKSAQARQMMLSKQPPQTGTGTMTAEAGTPSHVATSMDDDGGGSQPNWDSGLAAAGSDLFKDIPVGIREFMRTEKNLKLKHQQERAQA